MNDQIGMLDLLTILSFVLQIQNQGKLIDITDVQDEVNRAVNEIHAHLEAQDKRLDELIKKVSK